jgi:hypothetical protein
LKWPWAKYPADPNGHAAPVNGDSPLENSIPQTIPPTALDESPVDPAQSTFLGAAGGTYGQSLYGGMAGMVLPRGARGGDLGYRIPPKDATLIDRDQYIGGAAGLNESSTDDDFNSWRELYNPLYGITIERVIETMLRTQLGMWSDCTWYGKLMSERDDLLSGLISRRCGALAEMEVVHRPIKESALKGMGLTLADAQRQVDALEAGYSQIINMPEALEALCMATFWHHSHLEKIYAPTGKKGGYQIVKLAPVSPWHWKRRGPYYPWVYDAAALETMTGNRPDMTRFVVRVVDRHTLFLSMIYFVRKSFVMKKWDEFFEIYAIPAPQVTKPDPNSFPDQANSMTNGEWLNVLDGSRRNGAVWPAGTTVNFQPALRGDSNPFSMRLDKLEQLLVLSGTCGQFTMLQGQQSSFGHTGEAQQHGQSFAAVAAHDARAISQIFQDQLDRDILDLAGFKDRPVLAKTYLANDEAKTSEEVVQEVAGLTTAGYRVNPEQVSRDTGYEIIETAPLTAPAKGGSQDASQSVSGDSDSSESLQNSATDQLGMLTAEDRYALADSIDFAPLLSEKRRIVATASSPEEAAEKMFDADHDFIRNLPTGKAAHSLKVSMVRGFTGAVNSIKGRVVSNSDVPDEPRDPTGKWTVETHSAEEKRLRDITNKHDADARTAAAAGNDEEMYRHRALREAAKEVEILHRKEMPLTDAQRRGQIEAEESLKRQREAQARLAAKSNRPRGQSTAAHDRDYDRELRRRQE